MRACLSFFLTVYSATSISQNNYYPFFRGEKNLSSLLSHDTFSSSKNCDEREQEWRNFQNQFNELPYLHALSILLDCSVQLFPALVPSLGPRVILGCPVVKQKEWEVSLLWVLQSSFLSSEAAVGESLQQVESNEKVRKDTSQIDQY